MSKLEIKAIEGSEDLNDAFSVRRTVFQDEQGIDTREDFDGRDQAASHFVAYLNGQPIGTARVRKLEDGKVKVERVAVLKEHRGQDYGLRIMDGLLQHVKDHGATEAYLESQSYAAPFYERLGFAQEGDEFDEVGIPHVKMTKKL